MEPLPGNTVDCRLAVASGLLTAGRWVEFISGFTPLPAVLVGTRYTKNVSM